jgi:hypothetical protein
VDARLNDWTSNAPGLPQVELLVPPVSVLPVKDIYPSVVDGDGWCANGPAARWRFLGASVRPGSLPSHLDPQNLARFTFNKDLERTTADLTIRNKPLRGAARINHQLVALAAIRALNGFAHFHIRATANIPELGAMSNSFTG